MGFVEVVLGVTLVSRKRTTREQSRHTELASMHTRR